MICLIKSFVGVQGAVFQKSPLAAGGINNKDRGSVLFIVLIFIVAVTTLVLISTLRMNTEVEFLESEFSRLRAYTNCISGMELLKNRVCTGMYNNAEFLDGHYQAHEPRLLLDGSDIVFPSEEFILNLKDSSGLINVFKVERQLIKNLFEYHKIPVEKAEIVMDSIYDWMDADSFSRPNGAESPWYIKNYGYSAANRVMDSNPELLMIKGMDKEIYTRIGKYMDFSVENRGINPNCMAEELFHMFKGLGEAQIQKILHKRREKPIEGAAELTLVSGYNFTLYPSSLQFFTSNTTYVTIKSRMDEQRYFYIQFRLDRIAGGGSMRQSTAGGSLFGRNRSLEVFSNYYHIFSWSEGTEAIPQATQGRR